MEPSRSQRATEVLGRIDRGQENAAALMPIVYDELRDLAD